MFIDRLITRQESDLEAEPLVIGLRSEIARLERHLTIARGRARGKRAMAELSARVKAKTAQIERELGR